MEAKRKFEYVAKNILHESKESHDGCTKEALLTWVFFWCLQSRSRRLSAGGEVFTFFPELCRIQTELFRVVRVYEFKNLILFQ